MAGDEDDRHGGACGREPLLQLKTVEAGKRNVEHEAAWNQGLGPVEEFLGGRECLGLPAFAADQRFQRLAHGDIVVDNEDNWCDLWCDLQHG